MTGSLLAADTSVVIAAIAPWSSRLDEAGRALDQAREPIAHVLAETYSVLTRLPADMRLDPLLAAATLRGWFHGEVLMLPPDVAAELPLLLARKGICGGATYDAVVGLTALHNGRTLVTCDRRAASTYQALGVAVQFL